MSGAGDTSGQEQPGQEEVDAIVARIVARLPEILDEFLPGLLDELLPGLLDEILPGILDDVLPRVLDDAVLDDAVSSP